MLVFFFEIKGIIQDVILWKWRIRMVAFNDDKIQFYEETVVDEKVNSGVWKILIVDDEQIVHESTKMVLSDFVYQDKKLSFLCAYNSEEAKKFLSENDDIAIVLLDVVMEKDDSGLRLVKYIRDELQNKFIRIILRTGQPGQAPEEEVVVNYDINDYKMKTELTLQKLLTTIISALRSYSNIMELEINRRGLEKIINMEKELYELNTIDEFSALLLDKIKIMYNIGDDSFYLRKYNDERNGNKSIIHAATGIYKQYEGKELSRDAYDKLSDMFSSVHEKKGFIYRNDEYLVYYKSIDIIQNYLYFNGLNRLDDIEKRLFEIFISNLSVAFDNIALNEKLIQSQSELINRLSEVIEARSEETASHVKRVSEITYLLAKKNGLSDVESNLLRVVSPLHDVGKIGIPESILNKPGKLITEEFKIMKEHSMIGYRILKGSGLEILEAGALVAKQHHEYWNGNGYPLGLKGEEIHIFGRITIIADVFDALSHDRVYKKAWLFDDVIDFMEKKSGIMFDPSLVKILIENKKELEKLYENISD